MPPPLWEVALLGIFRARALMGAGNLAYGRGDLAPARAAYTEALELRFSRNDLRGTAGTLASIGNIANAAGDFMEEQSFFEEALALPRSIPSYAAACECLSGSRR